MGIKTLHLEIYGNVHEATIASLNEKAVRKIRTGLNKDFNMEDFFLKEGMKSITNK